ncbi:MAG: sulfotransferase [Verrucomicrobiota bacterium]
MKLLEQIFKSGTMPPPPLLRPDPVFIIGMHRSGTSALGGALEPLGLTVGKTVMPPNSDRGNPRGYYENLALTELHDRFLACIKSIWWDHKPVRKLRFLGPSARRFRKELVQLLIDEFGQGRPLIKDPRMCRLMPLWIPVIKKYFPQARFILPIRHPVEVAHSLLKRDQFKLDLGLKLWVVHVLESERTTRGLNRLFTTYDQLTQSSLETVVRLARNLGLPAETVPASLSGQIDPALRHHTNSVWPAGEPYEDLTLSIHQTLVSDESEKEGKLDRLRKEYYRQMDWKC